MSVVLAFCVSPLPSFEIVQVPVPVALPSLDLPRYSIVEGLMRLKECV